MGLIYGIAPVSVVMDMLNTDPEVYLTEQEVREIIKNMPLEYAEYVLKGNMIYHKALYPDDRGLLKAQEDKKYYIPNKEEIIDLGIKGYLPNNRELKKLVNYFVYQEGASYQQASFTGMLIQRSICGDCTMQEIFAILEEQELISDDDKKLKKLIGLVDDLWNNTRMLLNRGFTPNELKREERLTPVAPLMQPKASNVISFESVKKNKVYPNDPCPCGSGKKYKNCCRRK